MSAALPANGGRPPFRQKFANVCVLEAAVEPSFHRHTYLQLAVIWIKLHFWDMLYPTVMPLPSW